MHKNSKDLTNLKFGNLLAISPTEERKDNKVIWKCVCDCGKETLVKSSQLLGNKTKSCGCLTIQRINFKKLPLLRK